MAFNGNGIWVAPAGQPVAVGTVISSTVFNNLVTDIQNSFNLALTRDGQGVATAAFKLVDGTVTAPGLGFNGESASGLYRPSNGLLALTVSGIQQVLMTTSGVQFPTGVSSSLAVTTTNSLNTLSLTDTGSNGVNFKLTGNGGTTPSKYIRALAGNLEFVNSAYTAVMVSMTEAGGLNATGTVTGASGLFAGPVSGTSLALAGAITGATNITLSGTVSAANYVIANQLTTDAGSYGFTNSNGPGFITWGNASAGAGIMQFQGAGAKQLQINPVSTAVNYLGLQGGVTGTGPTINVAGADANVNLNFITKGTGSYVFYNGASSPQVVISGTTSTNYLSLGGGSPHPGMTTSGGMIQMAGAGVRVTGSGSSSNDVGATYSYVGSDKFQGVDSSRTANNKAYSVTWGGSVLQTFFVNDAFSASVPISSISGGYATGVTYQDFFAGAGTPVVRFTSTGANFGQQQVPIFQTQISGAGQNTGAWVDAGAKGGSLMLMDTASAGAGNGGFLGFGAFNTLAAFAGIKGYITDAANNTRGDIVFSTRAVSTDTHLTEIARVTATGFLNISGQTAGGLQMAGQITRFESAEQATQANTFLAQAAHGGTRKPDLIRCTLRCKVADNNWAVGSEVDIVPFGSGTAFANSFSNATNVGFVYTTTGQMCIQDPTTGGVVRITAASWRIVFYAHWL